MLPPVSSAAPAPLPTRCLFKLQGQALLENSPLPWILGILDMDDFREINELEGPSVGDAILQTLTEVLSHKQGLWARTGGDSFGLLIQASAEEIETLSADLLEQVQTAVKALTPRPVTASLGWASRPVDALAFEDLFLCAETALLSAKAAGKATARTYTGAIAQKALRSREVRQNFALAIASGDIRFFLQPQGNLRTHKVDGAEMLVRWRMPDGRLRFPGKFMPTVEENTPLIRGLGVLGLQEAARLRAKAGQSYRFSLNIGARHLLHPDFLNDVAGCCPDGTGITLEITESAPLVDVRRAERVLTELRTRGFWISLDDFGTGFSSLQHVAQLPLDEIKLDRAFLQNIRQSARSRAVVSAIQTLAWEADISLIAEGVSSHHALKRWEALKGERIQGFHLAPALPEEAFFTWAPWLMLAPQG